MGIIIDNDVKNQKSTPALYSDVFANIPAFGQTGRLFFATDTNIIYRDTGSAWVVFLSQVTPGISGSGTIGTIAKFTSASAIGNSSLIESATYVSTILKMAVGPTPGSTYALEVDGGINVATGHEYRKVGVSIFNSTNNNLPKFNTTTGTYSNSTITDDGSKVITSLPLFIGSNGTGNTGLEINRNLSTGAVSSDAFGFFNKGILTTDITGKAEYFATSVGSTGTFSLVDLYHFRAGKATTTGATITNQYGFAVDSTVIGATNNFGFYSNIASGANRYNFYANGTAINYFAGNVGIGTTSPSLPLHVYNSAAALVYFESTNASGAYAIWRNSGTSFGDVGSALGISGSGSASDFMFASRAGSMILGTSSAERMRITTAGNVGIGTSSPRIVLEVVGTDAASSSTSTPNGSIMVSNPTAANSQVMTMGVVNGGGNHAWIQSRNSSTANFYNLALNPSGGNVGIGTSSPSFQLELSTDSAGKPTSSLWTVASDLRIKENITPYTKGLKELMLINPINYDYNGLAGFKKGKGGVGIIAQEIIDILPDSVNSVKGKLKESDKKEIDILNFNGHELIYVLINAIKEQQAQIEELKLK